MFGATPFLWLYSHWRSWQLALQEPAVTQEAELLSLVQRAKATRFGRDHEFSRIRNVADFQARVPLRKYEDFWNQYWKQEFPTLEDCTWPGVIPYFCLTSGTTTGVTKYIPCSEDMLASNSRAVQDLLAFHMLNRPTSQLLGGKSFMLGGSTDLKEEAPGIFSGDLSGIEANEVPMWARPYTFPPRELALLADWEEKIDKVARLSLEEDIRAISGTPSWLLIFFDKLAEIRPEVEQLLVNYYPNLELVVYGGVDFRPYEARFARLLEGSHAELREVYPASEGFVAVADRAPGEGMRMVIDSGLFYEFVPVEELDSPAPTRHWMATVETGVDYALVISTCAGVWGYILGDTVRFVEVDPPRLLVTGRTSYVLSAFGEHLIDAEIEEAVADAARAIDSEVAEFCVAPVFPEGRGEKGWHRYLVEFAGEKPDKTRLREFGDVLDRRLRELNADYDAHRERDFGQHPPDIEALTPGTFMEWMKSRGQLGGQHKVPRIINDRDLFANLTAFVAEREAG